MQVLLLIFFGLLIYYFVTESTRKEMICRDCGYGGKLLKTAKGSGVIEFILWLCFLIPGLLYTIWRHSSRAYQCPKCSGWNMIPTNTPIGKSLVERNPQSAPQFTNVDFRDLWLKSHGLPSFNILMAAAGAVIILVIFVAVRKHEDIPATQAEEKNENKPQIVKKVSNSSVPNLNPPAIKLWKPNFESNRICVLKGNECRSIPSDDFYCTTEDLLNKQLAAEQIITDAGKKCQRWGKDRMLQQINGEVVDIPVQPEELARAVSLEEACYLNQVHISWLNGTDPEHYVSPRSDMVCFSKKDREKRSEFFGKILRRCEKWSD